MDELRRCACGAVVANETDTLCHEHVRFALLFEAHPEYLDLVKRMSEFGRWVEGLTDGLEEIGESMARYQAAAKEAGISERDCNQSGDVDCC